VYSITRRYQEAFISFFSFWVVVGMVTEAKRKVEEPSAVEQPAG
jgi:hypothetical protein